MTLTENSISIQILDRFSKLLETGRLAHAYLFVGPKCIGKEETALAVAKLVNCENPTQGRFCGMCPSCRKIENGAHPDVHILDKDDSLIEPDEDKKNKSIKIEHIRALIDKTQMTAFEAKMKVFIIKDVEFVTLEASNALLKTLEEPSKNTLIILTTSLIDRVLATIKSRCQIFQFFPLSSETLKERFVNRNRFSEPESHFLAHFSEGCPGRIADGDHQAILKRRNDAIDQFIFSQNEESYVKTILSDRDKTAEMIHFLFCWFKDLMLLKRDVSRNRIINIDRISDLEKVKARYDFDECEAILGEIVKTRKALEENFNVKISLALLKEKKWKK
ncbi:MAG: DNA polymerase III subunit delta' [Candidatus Omnitrophica bacterium]|nr:DNA polymerase III subunit delta' [Candidatus Omnitrophota bacterium]